jgi:hypothetical protein
MRAPPLLVEPTADPSPWMAAASHFSLPTHARPASEWLGKLPVACPRPLPVKARAISDAWPRKMRQVYVKICSPDTLLLLVPHHQESST